MNPILRNVLAVIIGLLVGGTVNMAIILISGSVMAPPEGADVTTTEGLIAAMGRFEPKHFIMPWLAHALGAFVGALLAAMIAATRKMTFAMVIGVFFLIGGIANVMMLPSPMWFNIVDIVGAYIPMAWLAFRLVKR